MGDFYTDVIMNDPRFRSMERVSDIYLLEPATRRKLQAIMTEAADHDIELLLYETFRSRQRQLELFRRGASTLRTVGGHHYGLACDVEISIREETARNSGFLLLGELTRKHGLVWAGDRGMSNARQTFFDPLYIVAALPTGMDGARPDDRQQRMTRNRPYMNALEAA